MNVRKCSSTGLLLLAVLLSTASAHYHPNCYPIPSKQAVSPWSQAAVKKRRSCVLTLMRGCYWTTALPLCENKFAQLALQFVAVQEHYDRDILESIVAKFLVEKGNTGEVKLVFPNASQSATVAYLLDMVKGKGDTTFDPEGLITRQEAAVMLSRAYGVYGGTFPKENQVRPFHDEEKIADWAKESAAILASWKVMNGTEDGFFAPKDTIPLSRALSPSFAL